MGHDIFDLIILFTLLGFTVRGFQLGLIGEVAGICSVIFGFWAASSWNGIVAPWLEFIADPNWRVITACVLIFFAVMLAIGVIARILQKIASWSFVGWINRLTGAILGFIKGVLIWLLLLIIISAILPQAEFLRTSRTLPYFKATIPYIQQWLPPDIAARIRLD